MTLRNSDLQSYSDLDSIRNSCDVFSNKNGQIYPKLNICKLWIISHLTFTRWKTVSIPAPIRPTSDRDTCSIAVIWHLELVTKLCASMARQIIFYESTIIGTYWTGVSKSISVPSQPYLSTSGLSDKSTSSAFWHFTPEILLWDQTKKIYIWST